MSPFARNQLKELQTRLTPYPFAQRIWEQVFSAKDKAHFKHLLEPTWERARYGIVSMFAEARRMSEDSAAVHLAVAIDMISGDTPNWLLSEINSDVPRDPLLSEKPNWDRLSGTLTYRNQPVRKIMSLAKARNIVMILDTFQESAWPNLIDDPQPDGRDPHRLSQTLKSLNRGLTAIKFSADGTGEAITWSIL